MKQNLDTLKQEIEEHLNKQGFSIFHGHSRMMGEKGLVIWDAEKYPDFKPFIQSAKAAGTQLIVLNERHFSMDIVDDALEQLEMSSLPLDEQRTFERRLKDLRVFDGFTCSVEISFDYQGRTYLYEVETEWYEELTSLIEDLEFLEDGGSPQDEDDEDAMGGYFSKN